MNEYAYDTAENDAAAQAGDAQPRRPGRPAGVKNGEHREPSRPPATMCIRTWKSDGKRWPVTLDHAVNVLCRKTRRLYEGDCRQRLLAGERMETDVSIYAVE